MKLVPPQSFTYRGGARAALLLHGYTGNTLHVRKLGRFLNDRGYTCHGPLYKGHGSTPEELLHTKPSEWWKSAVDGYEYLEQEGYEEIAVVGVSLGGVFSLRLGTLFPAKAIVSMCAPIREKDNEDILRRVLEYARWFKSIEGKEEPQIEKELIELAEEPLHSLDQLRKLISSTASQVKRISAPTMIMQGELDEDLYLESARIIYEDLTMPIKELKWYDQSGHILTMDKQHDLVFEDVYRFLQSLEWDATSSSGE